MNVTIKFLDGKQEDYEIDDTKELVEILESVATYAPPPIILTINSGSRLEFKRGGT